MRTSDLESLFSMQVKASRLAEPVREFRFHPTRKWRFDFAYPFLKLAVEIEGGTGVGGRHTRIGGFRSDCIKYNEAALLGWTVLRGDSQMVKSGDLLDYLEKAMERINKELRDRRLWEEI